MTWFDELFGFPETSPEDVRKNLLVDEAMLTSKANGKSWQFGRLETPTLAELRRRTPNAADLAGKTSVQEVVGDAKALHADPGNSGAMFQVASQFNLLEMLDPDTTPEAGIGIYQYDRTQGPVCAIAAGAGTIYRICLAAVIGRTSQSEHNQIDCLADLGEALGNQGQRPWAIRNGYALGTESVLADIAQQLKRASESERDQLRARLRIGLQWNTQVITPGCDNIVSQAYGSALPVAYSHLSEILWEPFARLVLEAAYDAVCCAARLNLARTGNDKLFLALIGGAFGNRNEWISDAIDRAVATHLDSGLDVRIVSYRESQDDVVHLIEGARNLSVNKLLNGWSSN